MEQRHQIDLLTATNPRNGRIDYRFAPAAREDIITIAETIRTAQPLWAARPLASRLAILDRLADEIACRRDAILSALIADTGRAAASAMEVDATRAILARWRGDAGLILAEGQHVVPHPGISANARPVPYALVGIITPWNSPLGLSMIDAIPALIAGAGVIVKPSEITPRFVVPLSDAITAVEELAPIFRFVAGDGRTGAAIVDVSDYLCFTGSVEKGRAIAAACGDRLVPVSLELGGKDAAIVLDGADLDRAAAGIFWSATFNSGQLCHSIERIYVARRLYTPFLERLVALAETTPLALSAPDAPGLGPFIDPRQAKQVEGQISAALASGACMIAGTGVEQHGGFWCRPTILTGVDHGMAIMTDETFGPVLPVMAFKHADEAVALVNDSRYGLSASVWGSEDEALRVARQLRAGGISINDVSLPSLFQGIEKSAFGVSGCGPSRMGAIGLRRFVRSQSTFVSRIGGGSPWWR